MTSLLRHVVQPNKNRERLERKKKRKKNKSTFCRFAKIAMGVLDKGEKRIIPSQNFTSVLR